MIARAPPLAGRLQFRLPDRMPINVLDENSRAERWTVVDAGAAVGVAAGSDFEVEGAIYLTFAVADEEAKNNYKVIYNERFVKWYEYQ